MPCQSLILHKSNGAPHVWDVQCIFEQNWSVGLAVWHLSLKVSNSSGIERPLICGSDGIWWDRLVGGESFVKWRCVSWGSKIIELTGSLYQLHPCWKTPCYGDSSLNLDYLLALFLSNDCPTLWLLLLNWKHGMLLLAIACLGYLALQCPWPLLILLSSPLLWL